LLYRILTDLLITAPLFYYLAIRKGDVSKFTVTQIFILRLSLQVLFNKIDSSPILQFNKALILLVIEAIVIFIGAIKIYVANNIAKSNILNNFDFLMHCRGEKFEIVEIRNGANIVSSEISVPV
jgi:uncharacterized membrane protein